MKGGGKVQRKAEKRDWPSPLNRLGPIENSTDANISSVPLLWKGEDTRELSGRQASGGVMVGPHFQHPGLESYR